MFYKVFLILSSHGKFPELENVLCYIQTEWDCPQYNLPLKSHFRDLLLNI